MFIEWMLVKSKLDNSTANQMEQNLHGRFGKIAKRFGTGLKNILTGGAIAAAIDKLLNPLKEIQEAMNSVLDKSDDLATNAAEFGTTAGELLKLQDIGRNVGVDPETMRMLLGKFESKQAEAKLDPNLQTPIRAFANDTNVAQSFFDFIQAIQKMPKEMRIAALEDVFNEKLRLKSASLFEPSTNLGAELKATGPTTANQITDAVTALNEKAHLQKQLTSAREEDDIRRKSGIITTSTIYADDASKRRKLGIQDEDIKNIKNLESMDEKADEVIKVLKEVGKGVSEMLGMFKLTGAPMMNAIHSMQKMTIKRGMRAIFGKQDKKGKK